MSKHVKFIVHPNIDDLNNDFQSCSAKTKCESWSRSYHKQIRPYRPRCRALGKVPDPKGLSGCTMKWPKNGLQQSLAKSLPHFEGEVNPGRLRAVAFEVGHRHLPTKWQPPKSGKKPKNMPNLPNFIHQHSVIQFLMNWDFFAGLNKCLWSSSWTTGHA